MKKEQKLHEAVCNYLRLQYPSIIFFSEPSGLRVSIGQAVQLKKLRSIGKLPDLFIAEPGFNKSYHGLFIEIKAEEIYKKNGTLKSNLHLKEQSNTLLRLNDRGYKAVFGVGFEEIKKIIDKYLCD